MNRKLDETWSIAHWRCGWALVAGGSGACPLGAACSAPAGAGGAGVPGSVPTSGGSDIYASAARERGHYVAYEPLGHYTQ